jgi:prepilin peptidase CpaA
MSFAMQVASHGSQSLSGSSTEWRRVIRTHAGSAATATCVTGAFVSVGKAEPLPALICAAAFLFLAIEQDLSRRRIPNWLTLPALMIAFSLAFCGLSVSPFDAALGAGLALAVGFLLFAAGVIGAGDVKAAMVLGVLWGPKTLAAAGIWMLAAGGVMALLLLTLRGGLPELLARWTRSVWLTVRTGRIHYLPPGANSVARMGLPFAVAMGLGAAALFAWGTPWI